MTAGADQVPSSPYRASSSTSCATLRFNAPGALIARGTTGKLQELTMSMKVDRATTRRRFVQFLAASPLLTGVGAPALAQSIPAPSRLPDPMVWAPRDLDKLISDPKEALDVFDFEPVAKRNLPPAHFGYMITGT